MFISFLPAYTNKCTCSLQRCEVQNSVIPINSYFVFSPHTLHFCFCLILLLYWCVLLFPLFLFFFFRNSKKKRKIKNTTQSWALEMEMGKIFLLRPKLFFLFLLPFFVFFWFQVLSVVLLDISLKYNFSRSHFVETHSVLVNFYCSAFNWYEHTQMDLSQKYPIQCGRKLS